jgi:hypothetical protein
LGLPLNLLGSGRFDCTTGWSAGIGLEIILGFRKDAGADFGGGEALDDLANLNTMNRHEYSFKARNCIMKLSAGKHFFIWRFPINL